MTSLAFHWSLVTNQEELSMTTADGSVLGTTQIFGTAPRNRAFSVVLLAEGFTNAQQNDFNNACTTFVNDFQITPPFNNLSSAINIFRVNVSSTDTGADDPAAAGGTGATASTYFDASFGGNNIRRLLVCNTTTALVVAAAQVPEFNVVLVVVNSTIYGGSGGTVGTYSLAGGATEIAIHEMGHTAFGLADEYAYYAGGSETGHDHHPPGEPSEPNVTTNTDRNTLKWRFAVATTTAIPTMSNPNCSQVDGRPSSVPVGTVGLFEGAHYYHCGAYRPEYTCKMQSLGTPFCRVCQQVISDRISTLLRQIQQPTPPNSSVSAVARKPEILDLFITGNDGRVYTSWFVEGVSDWSGINDNWRALGGFFPVGAPVSAVARKPGILDLFITGNDGRVYTSWFVEGVSDWSGINDNWRALGGFFPIPH
jgi:IgA Peptidase M64